MNSGNEGGTCLANSVFAGALQAIQLQPHVTRPILSTNDIPINRVYNGHNLIGTGQDFMLAAEDTGRKVPFMNYDPATGLFGTGPGGSGDKTSTNLPFGAYNSKNIQNPFSSAYLQNLQKHTFEQSQNLAVKGMNSTQSGAQQIQKMARKKRPLSMVQPTTMGDVVNHLFQENYAVYQEQLRDEAKMTFNERNMPVTAKPKVEDVIAGLFRSYNNGGGYNNTNQNSQPTNNPTQTTSNPVNILNSSGTPGAPVNQGGAVNAQIPSNSAINPPVQNNYATEEHAIADIITRNIPGFSQDPNAQMEVAKTMEEIRKLGFYSSAIFEDANLIDATAVLPQATLNLLDGFENIMLTLAKNGLASSQTALDLKAWMNTYFIQKFNLNPGNVQAGSKFRTAQLLNTKVTNNAVKTMKTPTKARFTPSLTPQSTSTLSNITIGGITVPYGTPLLNKTDNEIIILTDKNEAEVDFLISLDDDFSIAPVGASTLTPAKTSKPNRLKTPLKRTTRSSTLRK